MDFPQQVVTIARWEIRRSTGLIRRDIVPLAVILFILLVAVTGVTTREGIHLQDGLYRVGTDDPVIGRVLTADSRFQVTVTDPAGLSRPWPFYDAVILGGVARGSGTSRGQAAVLALKKDYEGYCDSVYSQQTDLYAAYPLWIDLQQVKSEISFASPAGGGPTISPVPGDAPPVPELPVEEVPVPSAEPPAEMETLRAGLVQAQGTDSQVLRYADLLGGRGSQGSFRVPSYLSPPLPFDSIILVFIFIFPLYFTSQFFMMSIMQERINRKGEVLLTTPVHPAALILGKALPYLLLMLGISAFLMGWVSAPPVVLLPLLPVVFFFLANALVIGMVSRSFRELSFISIFFSTVATSYLFFPSVFANVHVVSMISPLTLIVLSMQGQTFSVTDYLFSTSLFFLTSTVLFFVGVVNFREERLFSFQGIGSRIRDFTSSLLSPSHPCLALFGLNALLIPFVFMVQMMLLVVFFNLPMPLSIILLLISGAFVEEIAKALGITTFLTTARGRVPAWSLILAAFASGAAFLFGEKLLLLVTLAQVSQSVFGSVLFLSTGALLAPLLLHTGAVLITGAAVRWGGSRMIVPGILGATAVHCFYNYVILSGGMV